MSRRSSRIEIKHASCRRSCVYFYCETATCRRFCITSFRLSKYAFSSNILNDYCSTFLREGCFIAPFFPAPKLELSHKFCRCFVTFFMLQFSTLLACMMRLAACCQIFELWLLPRRMKCCSNPFQCYARIEYLH